MEKEGDSISNDTKICFLSNYPPKECGLATFTKDITCAMNKKFNPKLRSRVIALNDPEGHNRYDNRVIFQITRNSPQEYIEIAQKINTNEEIKLVCIQHEFGLFGGNYGDDILYFLDAIEKPVIVTFHSVLPNPNEERKKIVKKISAKASAIIVMANIAIEILNRDYGIEKSKMYVIHHGTPNAKFISPDQYKKKLNMEGKTVILTFGLLSRGKGIEYMIKSLPALVEKNPNLLYLILGETHPNVRMNEGESYRNELIELVKQLGLEKNVKFENRYVSLKDLIEHILACDIYAFTNLEREQITSGTLAYATSCGRPIVSTPIIYAEELLAQERGIIISNFKKPEKFTKALNKLLSDPSLRNRMSEAAYAFGRQMIWPNVAARHLNVFNRVVQLREEITKKYPTIKLEHLKRMTDSFGCIQFSNGSIPDKKSGYTLDDNARALISTVLYHNLSKSQISLNLSKKYLEFIEKTQKKDGRFINTFINKNKNMGDYSDDAIGRAIWALGYTVERSKNKLIVNKAEDLFDKAFPIIKDIESPRAKAFIILGLYHHYQKYGRKRDLEMIKTLADSLCILYEKCSSKDWHWFESGLSYSNAKLCEALFMAYLETRNEKHLEVAESSLHFLSDTVFINDELHPIGQDGWFDKNGKKASFDQQPVDAASMVSAYLAAYEATEDKHYHEKAVLAFNWFLGRNHLKQMIYNEDTGGCYDGLGEHSVNLNQGAESTICYLLARLRLEETKKGPN
ncbi:MAG: glycosyltransferase [Nanoarchaeota archaeon]|nr:glycosyltransferase [Nanoarchaeota archaeon]